MYILGIFVFELIDTYYDIKNIIYIYKKYKKKLFLIYLFFFFEKKIFFISFITLVSMVAYSVGMKVYISTSVLLLNDLELG